MTNEAKFNALRAKVLAAKRAADDHDITLGARYGASAARWQVMAWCRASERKTNERLHATLDKADKAMFEFMEAISPRDWSTGVPYAWVTRTLAYADAITRDALSVVPPCAYGSTPQDMNRFAEALK